MKPPFDGPLDTGFGQPEDGRMEARVSRLEADVSAIKIDVAVIKANGATKSDIAELKAAMDVRDARLEALFREELNAHGTQADKRFAEVDKRFTEVDKRFTEVDKRFTEVDRRFMEVDKRFTQVDQQLQQMQTEMRHQNELLRAEMRAYHSATSAEIAHSKNSIVMWLVTTVFVALVLPFIRDSLQNKAEQQTLPIHAAPASGRSVPTEPPLPPSVK